MPNKSSEDKELSESFRNVLMEECGSVQLRRVIGTTAPFDRKLWRRMVELGWTALAIPEAYGGLELGFRQLALLYAEAGRVLAPVPLLPTMLVADALIGFGSNEACAVYLPAIAAGEITGSVSASDDINLSFIRRGTTEIELEGTVDYLLDGANAILLLVFAVDGNGEPIALLVKPDDDGVSVLPRPAADPTRHMVSISFSGIALPATRIIAAGSRCIALQARLASHAALAIACDSAGGAETIFEKTLDYLKVRVQFDKPLGSFQALKHRCADHKVALASSAAVTDAAVFSWDSGADGADSRASIAKFYACDVYDAVADDALQMHGGIGLTWDYDCHLYLKRAKFNRVLFGSAERHADRAFRLLEPSLAAQ